MSVSRPKKALRISLAVSVVSLIIKTAAFILTSSTTALSDSVESIVHILSVAFVYYGFILSTKPADEQHLYGHERVEFLSVGIEGLVITGAGVLIIYESVQHLIHGHVLQNVVWGIVLLGTAGLINLALGTYLVNVGQREDNMIIISNGRHTLTDVWTSLGAVVTLLIVKYTGWVLLDALVGLGLGLFIIYQAYGLLRHAVDGIMDRSKPEVSDVIHAKLKKELPDSITDWHNLRHRTAGNTTWIEMHLVFEEDIGLKEAHDDATKIERKLIDAVRGDVVVTMHLEPAGVHKKMHQSLKDAKQERSMDDYI